MANPLRCIVFDFDGVILESNDVKTNTFAELYEPHGPDVVEKVLAHHHENLGISRFKKFAWIAENLLGRAISEAESVALGQRFSDLALAKVLAAPFVPGAERALTTIGLPMFVASGTPHAELCDIVERRGLAPRFREVHGTPREKPAILRDLMARHGFAAEELLFVGDGLSDYRAAMEVGVEFLARDTRPMRDQWAALGVRREPDLARLPELVATW